MRQSLQRKFLYGSVLASAIPIGVMLYEQATAQKPVIVKSEKERIKDLEARAELLYEPQELPALPAEEFQKMKQQTRQKHPGTKGELVAKGVKKSLIIVPYLSSQEFTQNKADLYALVEELFSFIDHPELTPPQFNIEVPRSRQEITASKDKLTVYAIEKFGTRYDCIISLDKKVIGSYLGISFHGGDAGEDIEVVQRNGTVEVKRAGGNILLAKPSDEIDRTTVFPAEVLHHTIRSASIESLRKKLQSATDTQGKLPKQVLDRFYQAQIMHEEGLVHAVVYSWLRKNRHKFQITAEELEERIKKDTSKERYKLVPQYCDSIEAIGARKTIDLYISNAE